MTTHSCNATASKTIAVILAPSIPKRQTVWRIMPVQVISFLPTRTMRIAEL